MHCSSWCLCNNRSNHSRFCVMNKETSYWKTAEQMNGRLAMMGFFAAVINYGFTGWIIPGFV
ncbi:MAG: chlorophyll a/b-binding protein [Prochlorococcus marinus]